ncbi:MAG TPA: APH(3') family aminoglycoside O-phosphotransferase [Caulobacteraceae bacterium]
MSSSTPTDALDRGLEDIAAEVLGAAGVPWSPRAVSAIGHGMSGDLVVRIEGDRPLIAKLVQRASHVSRAELAREAAALRWLDGRIGAPPVVWSGDAGGGPALLTEALAGTPLHELASDRAEAGARAATAALAELHALPIEGCPFDERMAVKLATARARLGAGEVDAAGFDSERTGRTPQAVLAELMGRVPPAEDLVVTHGDACWPNFILRPDGTAAIIDLGRFGVADRHQDLALFIRSAGHNFPDLPIRALLAAHYPVQPVDDAKLDFYRLLDEFY